MRHKYIPLELAQVGMVLSQTAQVVHHGFLSLALPAGHVLTEENLSQLSVHHAEFIYIDQPDDRSDEQVALDTAQAAGRVLTLFDGADLSEPNMAAFFDQVLAYRSA
ncbi:hypothetical protein [Rhodoferax sp.]|uniref:hypothetical protein n=1 Tax=Rhodoferax sp. TaxID=50421 RepID=UPI00262576B1|nr:hypothetical protein [Rhodoferax sp.]